MIDEMTDDKLKLGIALFMGYRWYNPPGFCSVFVSPQAIEKLNAEYLATTPARPKKYQIGLERADLPDWLNDLNCVATVEARIKEMGLAAQYANKLTEVVMGGQEIENFSLYLFALATVSPRQRCEAALACLENR